MERSGKCTEVKLIIPGGGVRHMKRVVATVQLRLFVFLFSCPVGVCVVSLDLLSLRRTSHGVRLACWQRSKKLFALFWSMTIWDNVKIGQCEYASNLHSFEYKCKRLHQLQKWSDRECYLMWEDDEFNDITYMHGSVSMTLGLASMCSWVYIHYSQVISLPISHHP